MAPSGGLMFPPDERQRFGLRWLLTSLAKLAIVVLLQSGHADTAAIARRQYYMDSSLDCLKVGTLDMPRDQVTFVSVYASTGKSDSLICSLMFAPKESGDTLNMWFQKDAFIGDCDVSLKMTMTDNERVWEPLDQYTLGCRSNNNQQPQMEAVNGQGTLKFTRTILSSTSYGFKIGVQATRTQDPAGAGDTSTGDIGMIVGIIVAGVVAVVLLLVLCVCCYRKKKRDAAFKVQGTDGQPNVAFENGKMNANYTGGSPSSEKKLLVENEDFGAKPKSALDRFGPTPVRRSDRPSKGSGRKDDQDDSDDPRRSPVLNDLRNNAKFRKSLQEREAGGSNESSTSYNSNGVPLPPKLPPVPRSPQRSPSPQRKGEKIAGIFRSRPSSSSSEIARQLEGDGPDSSQSEFVPSPRRDEKADTRHVLRPNRGQKKPPTLAEERRMQKDERDFEEEDDRRGRNRDRYRRDEEKEREAERERKRREEERERQKRMEEKEEEEEEKRRKKKEREREKRRQQEEDEEEEERDRKDRRRQEKEREKEDDRLEGRFKKSASGRRSKGKGPRKGRSKSTSNALEEMDAQYQRSRSKSPSSVRSLNFIEDDDDDDDLDSSYMPFKRAGSKTSLYASRSSLYGRRRKNSMGETISLSSYAYDDLDSRYGDFDKRGLSMSRRDKDKMFKSTGELEMHGATALVVRECATQTDSSKAVYVYGRKTLAKNRPGKMYSRGCQTGRTRRDSTGSARSGRSSRMRKSKSTESLRKRSKSRNLDESYDSSDDRMSHKSRSRRNLDESYDSDSRSRRHRSRSRNLDYSDDEDGRKNRKKKHHRSKSRGLEDDDDDKRSTKGRPRARPRKSTGAASVDLSDSDGGRSAAASSVAPSSYMPPQPTNPYGAQYVPVMFPPPAGMMSYQPVAPGGPPMAPGMIPPYNPQQQRGPPPPIGPKPPIAPKPKKSKWDELVEMTDKEKQHQPRNHRNDSPTESMLTSVYSHAPANGAHQQNYYAPPSYTTAQQYPHHQGPNSTISSAYPDSSGQPLSHHGGRRQYAYGPSESEI